MKTRRHCFLDAGNQIAKITASLLTFLILGAINTNRSHRFLFSKRTKNGVKFCHSLRQIVLPIRTHSRTDSVLLPDTGTSFEGNYINCLENTYYNQTPCISKRHCSTNGDKYSTLLDVISLPDRDHSQANSVMQSHPFVQQI